MHGGGFYHMVKYLVAPARMPEELTWFKWEAYATWLSGFALLVVVYYSGAELYLIDPPVLAICRSGRRSLISVAGLALGWVVYDRLCKSPLGAQRRRAVGGGLRVPGGARLRLHAACSAGAAPSCRWARWSARSWSPTCSW